VTGEARIGIARIPNAAAIGRIPRAAGQFVDTNQWESPGLLAEGLLGSVGAGRHDLSQPLSLGGFIEIFNLKYRACRVIDGPAGLWQARRALGRSETPGFAVDDTHFMDICSKIDAAEAPRRCRNEVARADPGRRPKRGLTADASFSVYVSSRSKRQ
jgi:hypothetical protein